MLSLEIQTGTSTADSTNSYFSYIEDKLNRVADRRACLEKTPGRDGLVVEFINMVQPANQSS